MNKSANPNKIAFLGWCLVSLAIFFANGKAQAQVTYYNGGQAASYAREWDATENSAYYNFASYWCGLHIGAQAPGNNLPNNGYCTWASYDSGSQSGPGGGDCSWCGGDCSNFASQCLIAGGANLTGTIDGHVIASVNKLGAWLRNQSGVSMETDTLLVETVVPSFTLAVGDLIQFGFNVLEGDNNPWDHSTIVVSVGSDPTNTKNITLGMHNDWGEKSLYDEENLFWDAHFYNLLSYKTPVAGESVTIKGPNSFPYSNNGGSYYAQLNLPVGVSDHIISCNWALSFFYEGGAYTPYSSPNQNGNTWSISKVSLAPGTLWSFDFSGLVPGMVVVIAQTTKGFLLDTEYVTYTPANVFPGYTDDDNKTITTAQPEIMAHYCIDVDKITVQSGGSINLDAGRCVNIYGLTVAKSASTVTIKVDTTLQ